MGKKKQEQQPATVKVKAPKERTFDERIKETKVKTAENKVRRDGIKNDRSQLKNEGKTVEIQRRANGEPKHGFGLNVHFFKRTGKDQTEPKRSFFGRRHKNKESTEQPRDAQGRFLPKQTTFDDIEPPKPRKQGPREAFADETIIPYKTEAVTVKGKKYKIPVDDNGKVPKSAIAARFLAVKEGTGKSNKRNVVLDHHQDAKEILPNDITPEQLKEWWAAPNTRDVEGIDNKDPPLFDVYGLIQKGAKEAHGKIAIDGTPEQQEIMRRTIAECFTVKEQKALVKKGGIVVHMRDDLPENVAAAYAGKRGGMSYQIYVNPEYIGDDSFLHEVIHHSRMVDDDREGILLRSRSASDSILVIDDDDHSLEEAATVLETLARYSPYKDPDYPSYHAYVASKKGGNAFDKIRHDRELVAGTSAPGSKGLRGKRARNAVKDKFNDSEISNLELPISQKSAKARLDELQKK